ncbi:hypothetical protein ASG89_14345 [Paenibacillus sp. Soil766]|uniref:hypothetical protein n=1 Tax=Paenibacillus sp. Soil766 TaxID=1736404 RepID=UPI00070B7619|nr:hypothetical protein [Paenibacillus sp. Soil766]KRE82433.1 hypothetical protein ASG89_14345 [Paenibacillus sp. Soil766]
MGKSSGIEVILWSIAFPGFGQILNGRFMKGLLLVSLEFIINSQSNLNKVIISSFHGDIGESIAQANYQWLMFYPCVYMFAIWDAYKDAGGVTTKPYSVVPVVFGAYFGTIGVMFSRDILGAVWLGLLGMFLGLGIGLLIKRILNKRATTSG